MKFDYYKFPLPGKSELFGNSIIRPIVPITIVDPSDKNKFINYNALIDSGADFCIFDAEIGEYLGLDIKSGDKEMFGGVQNGSGSEAFLHEIIMKIGGREYAAKVAFSYDISKDGYGILGQKGFFDEFAVKFDYSKEEIDLRPK
jgi:predicted aspartyl protease